MSPIEIRQGLRVLQNFYADKGQPHVLNDTQILAYGRSLSNFSPAQFEAAANTWMEQSKWFPALSDLVGLMRAIDTPVDDWWNECKRLHGVNEEGQPMCEQSEWHRLRLVRDGALTV